VSYDLRLTYREYRRKIFALADGLHKAGIKKGTKVAHLLPVTPEWAYLYWALHRLGAVLVPLNITWVGREIVQGLDLTDTEVLVVTDNFRGINYVSVLREMFPEMRKTVLRFRDGAYCGCNLFTLSTVSPTILTI